MRLCLQSASSLDNHRCYAPIDKTYAHFGRRFQFNYKGNTFECYFEAVSKALITLAKAFRPAKAPTRSNHRNLRFFADYYGGRPHLRRMMKDAEPTSFFIKGSFEAVGNDVATLAKSLNFYMSYFDRDSPEVILLTKQTTEKEYKHACYSIRHGFPSVISANEIDSTILDILAVARECNDMRLCFIFYFQVLEYCSYYYLGEKVRNRLINILRSPDVSANANVYVRQVVDELKNHFVQRDDSQKLEQAILQTCGIEDVRFEVEANIDYFKKNVEFDGGLVIPKLLNDTQAADDLGEAHLLQIKKNLEKIRNVLVHLREARENKSIMPTERNDMLLVPYLCIVRRLAEKAAIQFPQ